MRSTTSKPPRPLRSSPPPPSKSGRIETRRYVASTNVDWIASDRRYPGEPRFPGVATLIQVHSTTEQAGKTTRETRTYISSAPLDIDRIAAAIRGHWGVESMHWILDVQFKDDLSRYRQGHGAKGMAVVRRFALDLARAHKAKGSVTTRRLIATWGPEFLLKVLSL
jgi:predicted transposase YbfD/YdcC